MFDLHDIFIGSFISQRLVITAKKILMDLINQRSKTNNNEQIYEINALLNTDAIKANKAFLSFEADTKEVSELFQGDSLKSKIRGINDLSKVFSNC